MQFAPRTGVAVALCRRVAHSQKTEIWMRKIVRPAILDLDTVTGREAIASGAQQDLRPVAIPFQVSGRSAMQELFNRLDALWAAAIATRKR